MIAIIDYNIGNLSSVSNAFAKIGEKTAIVKNPTELEKYDKIVLPGVGAFGDAMQHLKSTGMDKAIVDFANSKKPLLGICLGMQLLFDSSNEFGYHEGLGIIKGDVVKFDKANFDNKNYKIPHMGWNKMFIKDDKLFEGISDPYLYFIHSYYVQCEEKYIIGKTNYGHEFTSAIKKENVYGFQPHPEKSHDNGLKILKNFTEI